MKASIPFLLRGGTLREYQYIGLDWLVTMYEKRLNGILADEMGLGKTIMTIAVLAHLACDRGSWGPHLIVVPTSVMLNWEMEFKKWCPGFKILTYYGNQKERKIKRTVGVVSSTEGLYDVDFQAYSPWLAVVFVLILNDFLGDTSKSITLRGLFVFVGLDKAERLPCLHHFLQTCCARSSVISQEEMEILDLR